MIPFWCACWIAWHTGMKSSRRSLVVKPVAVAVFGDRDAVDQLHDEERPAGVGRAGVKDLGDIVVVQDRQGLASASNRAMTSAESIPGLMTLSATFRRTG